MEAETLGEKLRIAQALVDTLADTLAKVAGGTPERTLGYAQALDVTLANSLEEVEA